MKHLKTTGFFLVLFFSFTPALFAQADSLAAYKTDSGFYTSFDGTKIYYEVRGSGEPVLLVHGFIVNSESWKRTALYADLLQQGYKVISLDLRGNGKSGKPHTDAAYSNDAEAKDIMGLLKFLKTKSYKAIGYSRGAIITARLLVLDKNIKGAVLGGMGADFTNPEWPRRIQFYRALSGEPVKGFESAVQYVERLGLDKPALALLQKHQPSTPPSMLAKINLPILVISGDADNDNGSAEELAGLIPRSVVARVPGDHNNTNKTKAFSAAVINFLK